MKHYKKLESGLDVFHTDPTGFGLYLHRASSSEKIFLSVSEVMKLSDLFRDYIVDNHADLFNSAYLDYVVRNEEMLRKIDSDFTVPLVCETCGQKFVSPLESAVAIHQDPAAYHHCEFCETKGGQL